MDNTQLRSILTDVEIVIIASGLQIAIEQYRDSMLVLIEGQLKLERKSVSDRASIVIADGLTPTLITSIANDAVITTLKVCKFIWLDKSLIDSHLAWQEILPFKPAIKANYSRHIPLVSQTNAFRKLTLDRVADAFTRMLRIDVEKGEEIVHQDEPGDAYFLLDSGTADVIQTHAQTGQINIVRKLKAGDGFGEEALVQKQTRNSTVKMTSNGVIYKLSADDFSELVQPALVKSVQYDRVKSILADNDVILVDCRHEQEYMLYRIPGSVFVPLHSLRDNINRFSKDKTYLAICHSGRRSQAAVFLLQERGFSAKYIEGGISQWPYELDYGDIELA